MARPIWLALILLIGICALALKISIALPPAQQTAFADDAIELPVNALAKADKLEVEETPFKKTIQSIVIEPQLAAPIPEKATKIVSHHWQDGFAKAKMWKLHHRLVSRKRPAGLKGVKMSKNGDKNKSAEDRDTDRIGRHPTAGRARVEG
jgi:hypothetical protein